MWYFLFLKILQNEIPDFFLSFERSILGSERVAGYDLNDAMLALFFRYYVFSLVLCYSDLEIPSWVCSGRSDKI